ncbi:NAD(P)/FAD-dependent oxidoreductase [Streptomyces sp. Ru71]|uniref:FAD-dependent oxidoreductase n=1 Tax=Streptomyces sp. Ru71 TaxID=2080746 RepID=UPI0015E471C3|nr:NAD(P)/FAD-dependent oxidoreductase [Streptomyces sp. Ru71]
MRPEAAGLAAPRQSTALIAGAGPAGLALAALLGSAGWQVTVLEQLAERRAGTRAPTLWPPAMHLLDTLGVGDRVREVSHLVERLRFASDDGERDLDLGPYAFRTLPQGELEEILQDRAGALGATVVRGATVTSVTTGPDGRPRVGVDHAAGTTEELTADLLVGADGAHSVVRRQLGIDTVGERYASRFALLDFTDTQKLFPRDASITWVGRRGTLVSVPLPAGGTRVVVPVLDPDADPADFLMKTAAEHGFPLFADTATWQAEFHVTVALAETFAHGHIALIGDAAHMQSPAGGRGMNNALEDAFTLASQLCDKAAGDRQDIPAALLRYAALRHAEMDDELGAIKATTDRWVGRTGTTAPAEAPERPRRSEIQRTACIHPRRPRTTDGAPLPPWATAEFTGSRMVLHGTRDTAWPPHPVVLVGAPDAPVASGLLPDGAWRARTATLLDGGTALPPGVYVTTASSDILGHWPWDRLTATDPNPVRTEIGQCLETQNHEPPH